ncbi:hypothetical protein RS75_24020 [Rhizobium nepotum 39/7]|uniref:Transposase n=1 Tax=Rhizobium nepotum 39/7 TaxID=1368418 RepID=A0ABR5CKF3_9HYPH|nr:hypothetical protein RS75_24020 [Rhizobium nepotum 39/7]
MARRVIGRKLHLSMSIIFVAWMNFDRSHHVRNDDEVQGRVASRDHPMRLALDELLLAPINQDCLI